jgi:flavin-binding protein dodecin
MERVARITEIIAGSPVIEQRVSVVDGKIAEYRVRMEVIFVLET